MLTWHQRQRQHDELKVLGLSSTTAPVLSTTTHWLAELHVLHGTLLKLSHLPQKPSTPPPPPPEAELSLRIHTLPFP